jgi:uncharacterized protein (DUF924 family)
MAEYKTPTDVLHFWFGEEALMGDIAHFRERCKTLWYAGTSADSLCVPFASTLEAAASGALDAHEEWSKPESYPDAAIAKILLYDQLARNIHRGTKKAFSFDERALEISRTLCADDAVVDHVGASAVHFILSPLIHSELMADHDLALDVNARLARRAKEIADGGRGAFIQHRDVINASDGTRTETRRWDGRARKKRKRGSRATTCRAGRRANRCYQCRYV